MRARSALLGCLSVVLLLAAILSAPAAAADEPYPSQATFELTEPGTYSCAPGDALQGSSCVSSYPASHQEGYYFCPSGGTLSGTTCFVTTSATYTPGGNWCLDLQRSAARTVHLSSCGDALVVKLRAAADSTFEVTEQLAPKETTTVTMQQRYRTVVAVPFGVDGRKLDTVKLGIAS